MVLRFLPVVLSLSLSLSLAACGARPDLGVTNGPGPVVVGGGGGLKLVVVPIDDLFQAGDKLKSARIVARKRGFDLLALQDSAPWNLLARRATVAADPLALDFAGPSSPIVVNTLDSFEAAASGDLLAVCHNHAVGDPLLFSSFTGAYAAGVSTTLFFGAAYCDGIALNGGTGLLAANKIPNGGRCCSRAVVTPISTAGVVTGQDVAALPDMEFSDVRLARYGQGYVTAGFVKAPAVFVRFAPDGGMVSSKELPVTAQDDTRPQLAAWPFDATWAAVGFADGQDKARIVAVRETGETKPIATLSRPTAKRITTPALTKVTDGLLYAFTACPGDTGRGSVVFELRGADGGVIAGPAELPVDCPSVVNTAAAFDDVALFGWAGLDGVVEGALVEVTR